MICFVASPIGEDGSDIRVHADKFLDYIVIPACKDTEYEVIRPDKLNTPEIITEETLEYLKSAELVVADLTGFNPNVFYEAGYRQALGLPLIFFRDEAFDKKGMLPFDIRAYRVFPYTTDYGDVLEAREKLQSAINSLKDFEPPLDPVKFLQILVDEYEQ